MKYENTLQNGDKFKENLQCLEKNGKIRVTVSRSCKFSTP